ncbi:ganglioside GM2 activator, partial [Aplysia californica]|uniref:Ganglioside GM2 activator n=1 Tax=Aplysia californica TaxID=6500 RepID=A0ABM0ZUX6_APLCA
MQVYGILVVLATVCLTSGQPLSTSEESELSSARGEVVRMWHFVRAVMRNLPSVAGTVPTEPSFRARDSSFSFKNCGNPEEEIIVVSDVSMKPDPVSIPGNVTLSGNVEIKDRIDAPINVDLELYKQLFGLWVKIPCVDNLGSCVYEDICQTLKEIECPEQLKRLGFPCKCPITPGNFAVKDFVYTIKESLPIPVSGDVRIVANVYSNDVLVTCAEVELKLA